jgi:nucleoid-associated protein YgaU
MPNRYRNCFLLNRRNEPSHFSTWSFPEKLKVLSAINWFDNTNPVNHTWSNGDRLDKLASKYYNDGTLWWIIAIANQINNPLDIEAGTVIKIPTDQNSVLEQLDLR